MKIHRTPAPWTASPVVSYPSGSPPARFEGAEIKSTCGKLYVFLHSKNPNYSISKMDAEIIANAQLIAAAPELLESLQEMVSMMDDGDEPGAGGEWHIKASAAITKALGETK